MSENENTQSQNIQKLSNQLRSIEEVLTPNYQRDKNGKITKAVVKPYYTKQFVTIVGLKTTTSRFLPVSHEGYSIETFIDKVELLGKTRAEFIARKMKGIERRAHMAMFREMIEDNSNDGKNKRKFTEIFEEKFGRVCYIPDQLCITCWNCSLFGGLRAGESAAFSRIRYFDTYSIEGAETCIAMDGSEEGMGIGNQVYEDLQKQRGAETYHQYEYVKVGTHFPFIVIIENPTLLDVAGYLKTVEIADNHGYGKYSVNHGKFSTQILAISSGFPKFSVLDMLGWGTGGIDKLITKFSNGSVKFETNKGDPVSLFGDDIVAVKNELVSEFKAYCDSLKDMGSK